MAIKPTQFEYGIDEENRITDVSAEWIAFANENGAEHLSREQIVGSSLFQFISDAETQVLYRAIFEKVRSGGQALRIQFRCDGPSVRRFMELEILPAPGQALHLIGHLLREEPRDSVPLFDCDADRSQKTLIVCSWCKRVQVEGEWLDVEEAVSRLQLFDGDILPQLSHGICMACALEVRGELERLRTPG